MADSKMIIEDLAVPLDDAAFKISETCEQLGEIIKEYQNTQKNFFASVEKNCATLAEYTANEIVARQKLIEDIHRNIVDDSKIITEKLTAPLENSQFQISKTCERINKFIEIHQKSQEKLWSNIENLLIEYKAQNIEVYNNITESLTNKVEVASDNIRNNLNIELDNFSNSNNKLEKDFNKISGEISKFAEEIQPLQEILFTIRFIKVAVSLALGTGIAACAISVIR